MNLIRSIKAYLCPNIINFDGVDFSECHSEEVMFLLRLRVDGKLVLYQIKAHSMGQHQEEDK